MHLSLHPIEDVCIIIKKKKRSVAYVFSLAVWRRHMDTDIYSIRWNKLERFKSASRQWFICLDFSSLATQLECLRQFQPNTHNKRTLLDDVYLTSHVVLVRSYASQLASCFVFLVNEKGARTSFVPCSRA